MRIGLVSKLCAQLKPGLPPVLFVGSTGIGKTQAIAQGAELSGRTLVAVPPLSTMLPEDASGIPIPHKEEGVVEFMPPDFWKIPGNALLFLDELNLARQDVLCALCSVLWPLADGKRKIGSINIPEDTLVVSAAMPPSSGVTVRQLPHFLRSRLAIISVESHLDDWIVWAQLNQLDPAVIAFITRNPNLLAPDPPNSQELEAFPTPRAWQAVSDSLIFEKLETELCEQRIAGLVGPGACNDFMQFRYNMSRLPDPIDVITGVIDFPSETSVQIATSAAIAEYLLTNANEELVKMYLKNSLEWPAELVTAYQFPVFQAATPKWRRDVGLELTQISVSNPEWVERFKSLFSAIHNV